METRLKNMALGALAASTLVLFMFAAPLAHGQTASPGAAKPASGDDEWKFLVAPYVWAVGVDSKVIIGNYSASSTMTFSDILSHTQAAGQVHLEAQKGKFGFFFDPTYLSLREDGTFTGARNGVAPPPTRDLTLTAEMWFVEFGGFYQVGTWPINGNSGQKITVDLLGGGRYWYLHGELDTTSPIHLSKTDDFIDPIIGARAAVNLTEKLIFNLRGDIGGFGVGSDFTWNAELETLDSLTNDVIAVAVDEKTAGYTERFSKWGSAQEAFRFWAERIVKSIDDNRVMK
jgi:hypothetical protein